MTDHDEMVLRIEKAMERFEASLLKPQRRRQWGREKVKANPHETRKGE